MIKIRLMRIGTRGQPFYRVVAVDERKKRTGGYLELLGTYNPLSEPKEIKLDQVKIDAWIKKGAQPSNGFLRIIGKAPQRPPRKPKKEKKDAPAAPVQVPTETPVEVAAAETPNTEEPQKEEAKITEAEEKRAEGGTDSQLSEAGEVSGESTSADVHEPDQAGSEPSEKAELENQEQPSEQKAEEEVQAETSPEEPAATEETKAPEEEKGA